MEKSFHIERKSKCIIFIALLVSTVLHFNASAQLVSGNAFLQGNFVEVGAAPCGSYGSSVLAPAGYHARSGGRLGFVADAGKDGWNVGSPNYVGDYFLPGSPEEGWGLTINGVSYNNNQICSETNIPGSFISYNATSTEKTATWQGSIAGLAISAKTIVPMNSVFFTTTVTLTNTSASTISNIYYMRNVDPDQGIETPGAGSTFITTNCIVYQNPNSSNKALASAVVAGNYLGLGSLDARARVTTGGFSNRNAKEIWDGTFYLTSGCRTADEAISVAFNIGNLAPGASTTFSYVYILDESQLDAGLASTLGAVTDITCNSATFKATSSQTGTGYWMVVPQNATAPTENQIKAGVDYGAVTVTANGSGIMSANVEKSFSITGLEPGAAYDIYFVSEDATPTFSSISKAQFTTHTPPVITSCVQDMEVANDAGKCGANVTFGTPVVSGTSPTISYSHVSGSYFPVGTTVVTVKATNECGEVSCSFKVTVKDKEAPVPDVESLPTQTADCSTTISAPTATDVCAGKITGTTTDPTVFSSEGTYTITWTYDDGNGNSTTQTQQVVVEDGTPPSITAPNNVTVNNDAGKCGAAKANVALGTANTNDNCGVASVSNDAPATFPVGTTTVTWTVTDVNGLQATATQTVTVTNADPVITSVAGPANPSPISTSVNLNVAYTDNNVTSAVIKWGDGSTDQTVTNPATSFTATHTYAAAGVYTVNVTCTDACSKTASYAYQYIVIYDPSAGFVTGGGTITSPLGAYYADPTLSGKATFGFVSKYEKGAKVPSGNTEFQFHAAGMNFKSTSYDWLVISGSKAQYKGYGTINGSGNYGFILTATDGALNSPVTADMLRIKIWEVTSSAKVYDNQLNASDDALPTTTIDNGSIIIHVPKGKTETLVSNRADQLFMEYTGELNVSVRPNPSKGSFELMLQSRKKTPATLRMVDELGRVLETRANISANSTQRVGESFRPGTYYAEVLQDGKRVTVKLIKTAN